MHTCFLRHAGLAFVCVFMLSNCKSQPVSESAALEETVTPAYASLLERLDDERADQSSVDSQTLSQTLDLMYQNVPTNDVKQFIFIILSSLRQSAGTAFDQSTLPKLLVGWLDGYISTSEANRLNSMLAGVEVMAAAETDALLQSFAGLLVRSYIFSKQHKTISTFIQDWLLHIPHLDALLDSFPKFKLSTIKTLQNLVLKKAQYNPTKTAEPFANGTQKPDALYTFKTDECTPVAESYAPIGDSARIGIKQGFQNLDKYILPCFQENSPQLAALLNFLSNGEKFDGLPLNVNFAGGEPTPIASYTDLLNFFALQGYTLETYTTRGWADFVNVAYFPNPQDPSVKHAIRLPTWFTSTVKGKQVSLPSEHSEIGVMLHKNNQRLAQVRFYLGLPVAGFENIPAFWRAHLEKNHNWLAVRHHLIGNFPPEQLTLAAPFFTAIAGTMAAMQNFQARLSTPLNAYGYLVCNDSETLVAAVLNQDNSSTVFSGAYPLLRFDGFTPRGSSTRFDVNGFLEDQLQLPASYLTSNYPSDLAGDGTGDMTKRLLQAFPVEDIGRFRFFPALQRQMNDLVWHPN